MSTTPVSKGALPEQASVVVIGGGVIGTSIAYHLAESGVEQVLLIERDELAAGSTCRAAGGVRATFSDPANIAIGLRGLEVYSTFEQRYGQSVDFHRDGYLYLLSHPGDVEIFTESVARQNRLGVPSRMIDPAEATRISPLIATDSCLAACWSPEDGKATPESVVLGYAAAARRAGARIIRHCAVTDIETRAGAITAVITDRGRVQTPAVVCAAGAWSRAIGEMVGIDIPVTPVRRQIAFTGRIDGLPARSPSLTIDFPSNLYFHPEGGRLLLGWSDPDETPGFKLDFEPEPWLDGVAEILERCAPQILDFGIESGWAGLYEVTPDEVQIIDRSAAVEGFLVATGFSGHGFLMGPATGEIIRDLYHERPPGYEIGDFALDRFARARPASEVNII
jgi:sarcosine oxidase subunit beta